MISKEARSLLKEIIEHENQTDYWSNRFSNLNKREDTILRGCFAELKNGNYIRVQWADNIPYYLFVTKEGYLFEDNNSNLLQNELNDLLLRASDIETLPSNKNRKKEETEWLDSVQIFIEEQLNNHPLNRRLKSLLFHRAPGAFEEVHSCLRAINRKTTDTKDIVVNTDMRGNYRMTKNEFIQEYIDKIEQLLADEQTLFKDDIGWSLVREIEGVFQHEIPTIDDGLLHNDYIDDLTIIKGRLKLELLGLDNEERGFRENKTPVVFLSHQSSDKQYGDVLRDFMSALGVPDSSIVYTSHPLNKIPNGLNIYDYLRSSLDETNYMIILWSDAYLDSPACLNEMGALWVLRRKYLSVYNPCFDFNNPKYSSCAVDTRQMGIILNGSQECKSRLIDFKNEIKTLFSIETDEQKEQLLLDKTIQKLTELNK